jgi:hypothetical protein
VSRNARNHAMASSMGRGAPEKEGVTGSLEGGQQTGSLEGGQHPEVGTRFEGLFGLRDRLACVILAADRVLDVLG